MADKKSIGWLPAEIGSVVLVLIVAFVLVSVDMHSFTSGGIDFAFNPLTTMCNADGTYTAEAEVIKNDQWSWNELDAEGKIVRQNTRTPMRAGEPACPADVERASYGSPITVGLSTQLIAALSALNSSISEGNCVERIPLRR